MPYYHKHHRSKRILPASRGYSLLELSIIFMANMLLLVLTFGGINRYMEERNLELTRKNLAQVREAIVMFAGKYKRLPCPDINTTTATNFNGREKKRTSPSTGNIIGCAEYGSLGAGFQLGTGSQLTHSKYQTVNGQPIATSASLGWIPYRDLGLSEAVSLDAWGGRMLYAVSHNLTITEDTGNVRIVGLTNLAESALQIYCTHPVADSATNIIVPDCTTGRTAPAVPKVSFLVYSAGPNQYGVVNKLSNENWRFVNFPDNWDVILLDEAANDLTVKTAVSGESSRKGSLLHQYIYRGRIEKGSTVYSEFDDMMVYHSSISLSTRLADLGLWN